MALLTCSRIMISKVRIAWLSRNSQLVTVIKGLRKRIRMKAMMSPYPKERTPLRPNKPKKEISKLKMKQNLKRMTVKRNPPTNFLLNKQTTKPPPKALTMLLPKALIMPLRQHL